MSEKYTVLPKLIPIYQKAFAGEPWFEVSRCACPRGFSAQRVGEHCQGPCGQLLIAEAYPRKKKLAEMKKTMKQNPTSIYVEKSERGDALLGALAYGTTPEKIYEARYKKRENPKVLETLRRYGGEILWLDEVFADRERRPKGNLKNFRAMCESMAQERGQKTIAFRSINERLIGKAKKVFGDRCDVYVFDDIGVPGGTSSLVIITL